MRHLRGSETRLYVREEIPFFTGTRVPPAELVTNLP
jgi:peroxiredoxin